MKTDELYEIVKKQDRNATLDGNVIKAGGWLDLSSLTSLPEGVTLSAGGWLFLGSLTTLPEGVTLSAGGWLDLSSLTTLPEGVTLSAGGSLYLHSLTSLPEGVTLSAGGWLFLGSLTTPEQTYRGKKIWIENIDGYAMQRLSSPKEVDGCEIYKAAYFNGQGTGERCYVAKCGKFTAHGKSAGEAIRDAKFKEHRENFGYAELVEQIRDRGTVTFNDYRLLTGACSFGLKEGIKSLGLPEETEELPLDRVLELSRNQYGGEQLAELFG